MGRPEENLNRKFTYTDYLTWPEEERWEIIDGIPYNMTPAPSTRHQQIVAALIASFFNNLKNTPSQVFGASFEVRLAEKDKNDKEIFTVVQPDIAIICDRTKLDARGCQGSPDLIVEVISPSTFRKDIKEKFYLYEKAGVLEYWLIYPEEKTVVVFRLGNDCKYGRPDVYTELDDIQSKIPDSFTIHLAEIFIDE